VHLLTLQFGWRCTSLLNPPPFYFLIGEARAYVAAA
jgi:hypothetical protein